VDILINNAGVYGGRINLDTVTTQDMQDVFQVNTIGPLLTIQQLHKKNLLGGANKPTLIANVSSKVGSIDDNKSGGGYAYRASKCALNIVTKSLSIDLASENIVATLLHPGYVQTDMTQGGGIINAEQSVSGMLSVLEKHSEEELQGRFRDYKNEEIPW
jgi:NAD(P)-dependent dehydrogenase (short-subunit alcohol dehydrogenase family)